MVALKVFLRCGIRYNTFVYTESTIIVGGTDVQQLVSSSHRSSACFQNTNGQKQCTKHVGQATADNPVTRVEAACPLLSIS